MKENNLRCLLQESENLWTWGEKVKVTNQMRTWGKVFEHKTTNKGLTLRLNLDSHKFKQELGKGCE